ncbi:MAG: hypothetical protein ABGF52_11945 [Candidatus Asgardarchaeum sp.]
MFEISNIESKLNLMYSIFKEEIMPCNWYDDKVVFVETLFFKDNNINNISYTYCPPDLSIKYLLENLRVLKEVKSTKVSEVMPLIYNNVKNVERTLNMLLIAKKLFKILDIIYERAPLMIKANNLDDELANDIQRRSSELYIKLRKNLKTQKDFNHVKAEIYNFLMAIRAILDEEIIKKIKDVFPETYKFAITSDDPFESIRNDLNDIEVELKAIPFYEKLSSKVSLIDGKETTSVNVYDISPIYVILFLEKFGYNNLRYSVLNKKITYE